jgi:hypothetical protein
MCHEHVSLSNIKWKVEFGNTTWHSNLVLNTLPVCLSTQVVMQLNCLLYHTILKITKSTKTMYSKTNQTYFTLSQYSQYGDAHKWRNTFLA